MHQVEMRNGTIQLVIETNNHTSWVASERFGKNDAKYYIHDQLIYPNERITPNKYKKKIH